jgi:ribosome-interacting GTPase 1
MAFHIERVEKHMSNYLEKLDRADEDKHSTQKIKATQETINNLKQQLAELKTLEKDVYTCPNNSQLMSGKPGKKNVLYI